MLLAIEFDNLHQILRSLYTDMMPLCGNMAGVAKGIAGLGALFYVAAKVWQSLASAEPIDVYPLLRPFVSQGVQQYARNANFRYERLPGAKGQTGI